MSEMAGEQPIIIVRRRGGGHDEHHGGAWKIAYADFMTAMMALFLVMWLVNASSEETKAAVASYFNPIDLTDRNARPRGIDDPVPGSAAGTDGDEDAPDDASGPDLSNLAGPREVPRAPATADAAASDPDAAADAVDAAADALDAARPFDPAAGAGLPADAFDPFALGGAATAVIVPAAAASPPAGPPSDPPSDPPSGRPVDDAGTPDGPASPDGTAIDLAAGTAESAVESEPTPEAARAAAAIAAELADALAAVEVDVVAEADTVVIRLADDPASGMFALGSSAPREGLAADLARVAATLDGRPGAVSVHGHTDARPFAGGGARDGNWRLSAERAGTAHALLVAGGLDPARVARVVAHADRAPREADALSPRNRRIEVRLALGGNDG